jgi:hypothetical protein
MSVRFPFMPPYRGLRRNSNSNIRIGSSASSGVMCRYMNLLACSMWIKNLKSGAKSISIRSVSMKWKACFNFSDESQRYLHPSLLLLLRLTHRDHIITLSLDPMISGFERIFDPAAIFP